MYKIFISILIFGLFLQIESSSAAESQGSISGKIVDKDKKNLPGASVSLNDSKGVVKGSITNSTGAFVIEKVPDGEYTLNITYIGFRSKQIQSISMNRLTREMNLGDIILLDEDVSTPEVEVTAQKQYIQTELDKVIINVEQNLTIQGGSALDVLQSAPQVTVDIEGNVSLRGNQNLKILIDGRPSGLTASNLLETIPASSIESIEIITNPSAKYEAEGSSGIINIILKKQKEIGLNGMVTGNAGTLQSYNGAIDLNYKTGSSNLFGSYNIYDRNRTGIFNSTQTITSQGNESTVIQNGDFNRGGLSQSFKLGIDYKFDDLNSITTYGVYQFGRRESFDSTMFSTPMAPSIQNNDFVNLTNEDRPYQNLDYTFSFLHNFGTKRHDLNLDFYLNSTNQDQSSYFERIPYADSLSNSLIQSNDENGNYHYYTIKADYTNPLSKSRNLEAGFNASRRLNDNEFSYYNYENDLPVYDSIVSNRFLYTENIIAAYSNFSDKFGAFSMQLGLRAEMTDTEGNQITTDSLFNIDYFSLFPSAFLKYDFSDYQSLKLNYSRRIGRPWYRQLNPFVDYEDPLNIRVGNPKLLPEYMNSYEIAYTGIMNKTTLTSSVYYKQNENTISRIRKPIDSIRTITTYENIAREKAYGIELIWAQDIIDKWRFDLSGTYYKSIFEGEAYGINLNNSSFNWNTKFNTYFTVFAIVDFQISAYYSGPTNTAQGQYDDYFWSDMGMKINLLDGDLRINLKLSDIFNTGRWSGKSFGEDFETSYLWKRESRELSIGFSYKFNNYRRQREKRMDDGRTGDPDGN